MSLSLRNQSIDLLCKSIDWFLCERDINRLRVKKGAELFKAFYVKENQSKYNVTYFPFIFKYFNCPWTQNGYRTDIKRSKNV